MRRFNLPELQFIKLFRLPQHVVGLFINKVAPFLVPPSRTSALDVPTKVLTALKFYAGGSYQHDVGMNIYTAVSQPSVSRCVREVSRALNHPTIFGNYVKYPATKAELDLTRHE